MKVNQSSYNNIIQNSNEERKTVQQKKIIKLAGLNMGIALVNTILFSPGLLGIEIGGSSVFTTAFGITFILMSLVVFIYGNYSIITEKEKLLQTSTIKTTEDYIDALKYSFSKKTFKNDITYILEQIERLQNKNETIKDILLQKFNSTELSYQKFEGTIKAIEDVFFINIRSVLNKLNAFDEEEYCRIHESSDKEGFSTELRQTKISIYNEYISFVKDAIQDNEQIILKLDKLLLELSKLNTLESGEIENMDAMKEIDDLINKTKFYK